MGYYHTYTKSEAGNKTGLRIRVILPDEERVVERMRPGGRREGMNKQFQGSKKKGRKKLWLDREAKRAARRFDCMAYIKAMESGNIEEVARVMGTKLK